jgi:hypothetical protein
MNVRMSLSVWIEGFYTVSRVGRALKVGKGRETSRFCIVSKKGIIAPCSNGYRPMQTKPHYPSSKTNVSSCRSEKNNSAQLEKSP